MPKSLYIIDYGVYFDKRFETHQIKVKNCLSELEAKIKLEGYCKKKYSNFESLVVYKCLNDWLGFSDLFDRFHKIGAGNTLIPEGGCEECDCHALKLVIIFRYVKLFSIFAS